MSINRNSRHFMHCDLVPHSLLCADRLFVRWMRLMIFDFVYFGFLFYSFVYEHV